MDALGMKQTCLDLSNAAMALFDLIDENGIEAPLEDDKGVMTIMNVLNNSEVIRGYYSRRTVQRMLALGVPPDGILRMIGEQ